MTRENWKDKPCPLCGSTTMSLANGSHMRTVRRCTMCGAWTDGRGGVWTRSGRAELNWSRTPGKGGWNGVDTVSRKMGMDKVPDGSLAVAVAAEEEDAE